MDRVFKSPWFNKAARKARISDQELCKAVREVMSGQCDDPGGGVFKKRLGLNRYRSIILARSGHYWVYEYLFAKQDRANIRDDERDGFRKLAAAYSKLSEPKIERLMRDHKFVEICHAETA